MTVTCSPEEAIAFVRPRDTVGFGLGPGNPDAFLNALGDRDDWEDLVLGGALLLGYYTVLTKPGVSYRSGFFGPAERVLLAEGHEVELVPGGFRQFAPILARFAPRIMTAQAAPPDADGRSNLSLHLGATVTSSSERAKTPTGCSSSRSTRICPGLTASLREFDNSLPLNLVDVLVEADGEPYALEDPEPTEEDAAIAANAPHAVRDRRQHFADGDRLGIPTSSRRRWPKDPAANTACTPRCSRQDLCACTRRARSRTRSKGVSTASQ